MSKQSKQFEKADCSYGAPMGRREYHSDFSGKSRCFKVKLDNGGYDDGYCYWGLNSGGCSLYCATNGKGFRMFTRIPNRKIAKEEFQSRAKQYGKKITWIN